MLLLLFFFNLGLAVTLLFCLSATTATAAIVMLPGLRRVRAGLVNSGLLWEGKRFQCPQSSFQCSVHDSVVLILKYIINSHSVIYFIVAINS